MTSDNALNLFTNNQIKELVNLSKINDLDWY
jgi:hypothetical protein